MRQAEARAFRSTSSFTFMRRAGEAVARLVERRFAKTTQVVVACGRGNNGGDGYIAAQKLATKGFSVLVLGLGESRGLDAVRACKLCLLTRIGIDELDACIEGAAAGEKILLIDAMVGIGLTRPLEGMEQSVARRFAKAHGDGSAAVLAVDLPSGLFSDSPCVEEGGVVAADLTLCFFRKKPAHVLLPSRALCGEIVCEDIGFNEEDCPNTDIFENEPALFAHAAFCQPLPLQTHKHRRGSVVVVRSQMAGAAALAVEGATRSGVGLVRLLNDQTTPLPPVLSGLPASVIEDGRSLQEAILDAVQGRRERTAFAYGFGAPPSEQTLSVVRALTASRCRLVLDAGALRAMGRFGSGSPDIFSSLQSPVVLTPHDDEFRDLFACDQALLDEANPFVRARLAARLAGAVVVVKGGDTLVASPDGRLSVLVESSPCLATAGSGDVLAGFIAGFLAEEEDAFLAASAAVWLHAQAGRELERTHARTLRADDLPRAMAERFARLLLCE